MAENKKNLYFVALIPPDEVYHQVLSFKKDVAQRFRSKAALKSPPHITLHMPFSWREDREERLFEVLASATDSQEPMLIRQQGFGSFAPRVIFINVENTEELDDFQHRLKRKMRTNLKLENADYKDKPFHPHMTIAFRDLKKSVFPEAWDYYKEQKFAEEWQCDHLALLRHNGNSWDVYRLFKF